MGRLHHPVDGAVAAGEEPLTKAEGEVVDDLGFLVRKKCLVVAVRREKAGLLWDRGHTLTLPVHVRQAYEL
jgi:hypothetical protein